MKKMITICITGIILFTINNVSLADDIEEEFTIEEIQENIIEASTNEEKQPQINSQAGLIFDRTSKKVLWEKGGYEKRAMASTTKIMTAIIVLENSNLTDIVEVSKKAAGTGGSRLGLKTGDKITIKDLLYGLMLRSGNDSAVALAEYVGGDVEGFSKLMNQKVKELGLKNTNFITPHGLDQEEHYTTAYELAQITDYALNNSKFRQIVGTKTYNITINGGVKTINNTNELLGNLHGVDGVKTGFTNNAGRCLVTSATRDGHQLIFVVLGANTKKIRTIDSTKLIEYAFSSYEYIDIEKLAKEEFQEWLEQSCRLQLDKKKQIEPQIILQKIEDEERYKPISKSMIKDIKVNIDYKEKFEVPILPNTVIGNLQVKVKDEILLNKNIIIENEIQKKDVKDYFIQILYNYSNYIQEQIKKF